MTDILELKKIKDARVVDDNFPFFTVSNAFIDKLIIKSLVEDFPLVSAGGSFLSKDLNAGPSFLKLVKELEGKKLRKILEKKFKIDLSDKPVVTTFRGYSRKKDGKIHSDSKTKIITVLLYLNEKWTHKNGRLRLLPGDKNIDEYLIEIPATLGSLVAFKVEKNCWHGYKSFVGNRLALQLNYLYEESLVKHNLRHKLSSETKKLLGLLFK